MNSLISKIRSPQPVVETTPERPADEETKGGFDTGAPAAEPPPGYYEDDSDRVDDDVQHGIQAAQATTKVWSKGSLIAAYVL